MAKKPRPITYDVHPSIAMVQDWIASLKEKTGRSLSEWTKFIRAEGPKDEKACRVWLKDEHELGTNVAGWLAERALAPKGTKFDDDPESYLELAPTYVAAQYAGKKEHLLPIYTRLLEIARDLGPDITVCPCKTMVPIYRAHVIANITPRTQKQIDLGLCLTPLVKAGKRLPSRLIDTGGIAKKDRITHRIELAWIDQIDEFVEEWLLVAYDQDTPATKPKALKLR